MKNEAAGSSGPLPRAVRSAARHLAVRLGQKRTVFGVTVVDLIVRDEDRRAGSAVDLAIGLIARHDPIRHRRMLQDVRYVVVAHTVGWAGEYREDIRSILLDASHVLKQSVESCAMVIVHEATHARLCRMGVGRHPDRARIEGVCVRAEIEFARKVAGTERLIVGAKAKLATRYWEGSVPAGADLYLKHLGFPGWARRIFGLP
jgi:hypothetical protein